MALPVEDRVLKKENKAKGKKFYSVLHYHMSIPHSNFTFRPFTDQRRYENSTGWDRTLTEPSCNGSERFENFLEQQERFGRLILGSMF